jgi:1-deoxy-D-xylulose-5-phosphate synthase
MENLSFLSQINEPRDVRELRPAALEKLAEEIRRVIIDTVSKNGGHLASNLGVVELTLALHRVFDSPRDKIVWDVGHQCYTHKLLTGRYARFSSIRQSGGLAGFPKNNESPHDVFNTGHASTSISAALGLLAGNALKNDDSKVIAVIGDGALTGGLAYEALSHAGQLGLPLIVILNDNNMSISETQGGLSKYLSRLSMKAKYQSFKRGFDSLVKRIPLAGKTIYNAVLRLKRAVKAVFYTDNFFVDLGFEYVGPINGHSFSQLEGVLTDVKKLYHPVVVHVITRKGKGYEFAEANPSEYHGVSSFSVEEGIFKEKRKKDFTGAFSAALIEAASEDKRVIAITAAMEQGTGLSPFKEKFPERFFDAGIAEEHTVTFAAGLARQGLRPVVAVYATFIQRSCDQIIHDVSLQNLPVVFCLDRAGFVGGDGETHQGLFDVALFRMPGAFTLLAPASGSELRFMLKYALKSRGPVMIRYPKAGCPDEIEAFSTPLEKGRGAFIQKTGGNVCIAFTGSLYPQVMDAAERLAKAGVQADVYNLRFLKPIDENYLVSLLNSYKTFVFFEEAACMCGFGEYGAALAVNRRCTARVLTLAAPETPETLGSREELLRMNGLDGAGAARFILSQLHTAL